MEEGSPVILTYQSSNGESGSLASVIRISGEHRAISFGAIYGMCAYFFCCNLYNNKGRRVSILANLNTTDCMTWLFTH